MTQDGSYELNWNGNLLVVTGTGFWQPELMARYERDLKDKLRLAPASGFGFLVDLSQSPAQDGAIVERHGQTTDWLEAAGCHASAMVIDSALLRMQVKRASGGRIPLAQFGTRAEALTWLETQT